MPSFKSTVSHRTWKCERRVFVVSLDDNNNNGDDDEMPVRYLHWWCVNSFDPCWIDLGCWFWLYCCGILTRKTLFGGIVGAQRGRCKDKYGRYPTSAICFLLVALLWGHISGTVIGGSCKKLLLNYSYESARKSYRPYPVPFNALGRRMFLSTLPLDPHIMESSGEEMVLTHASFHMENILVGHNGKNSGNTRPGWKRVKYPARLRRHSRSKPLRLKF